MSTPTDTRFCDCEFEIDYVIGNLPAMRALERRVLGCDYGGTSWTTRTQVDQIAESLSLEPGVMLLEVGAGSGWPGLFVARLTGCDVTLVDIPLLALQLAAERADEEGLEEQARGIVASGAALPFREECFDTVSHSDVLCCTPEKEAMLAECRRVARPGAKMLFFVIAPAPHLCDTDYRDAVDASPPFGEIPGDYADMLRESGWRLLERIDVTVQFGQSLRTLVQGMTASEKALTEALGEEEFRCMQQRRETQLAAIRRGLLQREVFVSITA